MAYTPREVRPVGRMAPSSKRMALPHRLAPCSTSEYPTAAVRPRNSILENRRLKEEGLDVMRPWEEALEEFVALNGRALLEEVNA